MSWRVGYPDRYLHLDEQHEAFVQKLDELKGQSAHTADGSIVFEAREICKLLRQHIDSEETAMDASGYSKSDLHKKYHQFSLETFETVLEMCEGSYLREHLSQVVDHIRNRLSEEIFVDHHFAAFLRTREGDVA